MENNSDMEEKAIAGTRVFNYEDDALNNIVDIDSLSSSPVPAPARSINEWKGEYPPGYRFCPLDGELVYYYLKNKIRNLPLPHSKIKDVNLYNTTPDKLSAEHEVVEGNEWYFFTPRDRKYRNGSRPNRAAGSGYWKATGADRPVSFQNKVVGYRKALVFYEGRPPKGAKTNWIMHEYRVNDPPRTRTSQNDMRLDDWVLCKIYNKSDKLRSQLRDDEPCAANHNSSNSADRSDNSLAIIRNPIPPLHETDHHHHLNNDNSLFVPMEDDYASFGRFFTDSPGEEATLMNGPLCSIFSQPSPPVLSNVLFPPANNNFFPEFSHHIDEYLSFQQQQHVASFSWTDPIIRTSSPQFKPLSIPMTMNNNLRHQQVLHVDIRTSTTTNNYINSSYQNLDDVLVVANDDHDAHPLGDDDDDSPSNLQHSR